MVKSIIVSILACLAVAVLLSAGIYAARAVNYDSEILKIEKEIQLQELKNQQQKAVIAYRERERQEQRLTRLDDSTLGSVVMGTRYTFGQLWFLVPIGFAGAGMLLYGYSRKLTTKQTIAMLRHEEHKDAEIAALRIVEKAVPVISRAVVASIPRQAHVVPDAIDITPEPEALRAFTGPVYFSQAKLDPDYDERLIMWGRDTETGGIRQQPLEDVESLCLNGIQRAGKSTLLEAIAHNSLLRQYVYGESVRTVLIDLHAGAPRDSLSKKLESYCPGILRLFHRAFLGEQAIEQGLVNYFDELFESFQPGEDPECEELVIVFDEYTETISNLQAGKEIESRVKRLFNRRKYGVRLVLAMFESSKNGQSAKGLNVSKMAVSKALFRMDSAEGKRFLKDAEGCQTLDKGEYLLMTPGELESSRIQGPLFSSIDFQPFEKYTQDAPALPGDAENDSANDEQHITPEAVRSYLEREGMSQNALAKSAGLSSKNMSLFMNGKRDLKPSEEESLLAILHPEKMESEQKIVDFAKYRNA